jgi:hypothetical protein
VALATFGGFPDLYDDDRLALPHLEAAGIHATPAVWDDPGVTWSAYDLVVVRSTWDYTTRRDEFLEWAGSVPRLLNPVEVLRWNTDKHYLADLAEAGVPVVPTAFVEPGDVHEVPPYEHVVKPTVSANAQDTARFAAGQDSSAHAQRLLDAGRPLMVQPYQRAVDDDGETAVLLFDGAHSHAARKAPVLVPELADPEDVAITPRDARAAELDVARAALAAVPWPEPLLYARVDLVPGPDGAPLLMELELTEPSLFLAQSPGAAARFAQAVRDRL